MFIGSHCRTRLILFTTIDYGRTKGAADLVFSLLIKPNVPQLR